MVAEAPGPRATVLVDSAERGAWTLTCIVRGKGMVFRSELHPWRVETGICRAARYPLEEKAAQRPRVPDPAG